MSTMMDSGKASTQTAMEKFGSGGMALLPWTKHILTVLWEQFRMLVQVIYISFMSVFQMFRFEVHLRITDESGHQHIGTTTNPTESLLFSSLFDGENGVMVGGSNPLSNFCADVGDAFNGSSTAEALLSSLRGDDLCCGLVEDFVSRASSKEDGLFVGHHPSWNMGFAGDWHIYAPSTDTADAPQTSHKNTGKAFKQDISEEERSPHWSSEEEQSQGDFDSEESRALWESLSKSSDPYNPFFFSACISTNTNMGKSKQEGKSGSDTECTPPSKASEQQAGPAGLNIWVSRSDSESSWGSSDGSCADLDKEESERLWELFSTPLDPYNPMFFTACTTSQNHQLQPALPNLLQPAHRASIAAPLSKLTESTHAPLPSEEEEEEQLWKSLFQNDDPYHPLNFQACLHSSDIELSPKPKSGGAPDDPDARLLQSPPSAAEKNTERAVLPESTRVFQPLWSERLRTCHFHPERTRVIWKRPAKTSGLSTEAKEHCKATTSKKKVRFSPVVQVHVMSTWSFARRASRKGHWEEMVRDRDRFQRRIEDVGKAIGHCFSRHHREQIQVYLDGTLN